MISRGWFVSLFFIGMLSATSAFASLSPADYDRLMKAQSTLAQTPQQSLTVFKQIDERVNKKNIQLKVSLGHLIVQAYQQLNDIAGAINQLKVTQELLTADNKLFAPGEALLAYLYYQNQQYRFCSQHSESALADKDYSSQVTQASQSSVLAANCYYQLQNFPAAVKHIEYAIRISPAPSEGWYRFALSLYQQSQHWDKAIHLLEKTLTLDYPKKKEYWNTLVSAYIQKKHYQQALSTIRVMQRYIPLDKSLAQQQVTLYRMTRQPYQAAKALESAIQKGLIVPEVRHYQLLAELFIRSKARNDAMQYLSILEKRTFRHSPKVWQEAVMQKASLAYQQGNWLVLQKSLLNVEHSTQSLTQQWRILLSMSYVEHNQWNEAIAVLSPLIEKEDAQAMRLSNYIRYLSE